VGVSVGDGDRDDGTRKEVDRLSREGSSRDRRSDLARESIDEGVFRFEKLWGLYVDNLGGYVGVVESYSGQGPLRLSKMKMKSFEDFTVEF
jgi:hypothetical protein